MKSFLPGPLPDHPRNIMRRIGYGEYRSREGEVSYMKRLRGDLYPRFHAYVEEKKGGLQINLHLDQKQPSYGGSHAHAGEYEGSTVEREMERLFGLIQNLPSAQRRDSSDDDEEPRDEGRGAGEEKKGGFFSRLFG